MTLNSEVFGIEPNDHAIYLDVKQILANRRQGTHKSKERAEVSYSTKKLKRQKGTGGARAGSIKSPMARLARFIMAAGPGRSNTNFTVARPISDGNLLERSDSIVSSVKECSGSAGTRENRSRGARTASGGSGL
jgi:large subunit ribosomal protein L4